MEPALPQKLETTRPAAPFRPPLLSPRPPLSRVLHPLPLAAVPPAPSDERPFSEAVLREGRSHVPLQPSPKKETARIALLPQPSPSAAPAKLPPGAAAPSNSINAFDSVPGWLCWGLLGLSAFIFLIQIWNYALS